MSNAAEALGPRPPAAASEPAPCGLAASAATRRQRLRQTAAFTVLAASSTLVLIPAVAIVAFVAAKGLPSVNWEFLSAMPRGGMKEGGILPALYGSALLVVLTLLLALPVGVLGAVYLSEYARTGPLVRAIRVAILNLAGVPSIVYGLFGMGVFVVLVMPWLMGVLGLSPETHSPACLLAAAATMALLVLPMVVTTTEEALRQVPRHYRDSSLALGATKWQTVRRVVLPNALPGILTGVMLSIGRAAGETAPILLTGAAFYIPSLSSPGDALFQPFMALPYHLFATSTQLPDAPESLKWGTAFVLLATVLAFNGAGVALRAYLRRKKR
jgi:phosphate transport system permease protein